MGILFGRVSLSSLSSSSSTLSSWINVLLCDRDQRCFIAISALGIKAHQAVVVCWRLIFLSFASFFSRFIFSMPCASSHRRCVVNRSWRSMRTHSLDLSVCVIFAIKKCAMHWWLLWHIIPIYDNRRLNVVLIELFNSTPRRVNTSSSQVVLKTFCSLGCVSRSFVGLLARLRHTIDICTAIWFVFI